MAIWFVIILAVAGFGSGPSEPAPTTAGIIGQIIYYGRQQRAMENFWVMYIGFIIVKFLKCVEVWDWPRTLWQDALFFVTISLAIAIECTRYEALHHRTPEWNAYWEMSRQQMEQWRRRPG